MEPLCHDLISAERVMLVYRY